MTTDTQTAVRQRDGVAVIDVMGDVDARAAASLEAAWTEALADHPSAVALNFTHTGYINSTGIALIVGLLAAARAQRMPIRAFGLTPHYLEIFEITRLSDFLAISPDEDAATTDPHTDSDDDREGTHR
jgi:anti-anti-sigma factor